VIFVDADDDEADNADVYRLEPWAQELDLRPALREQWLLSDPGFVLCREDCQGLCATCGADLNAGACGCPPRTAIDSRWDALRKLGAAAGDEAPAQSRDTRATRASTKKKRNRS